MKPNLFSFIKFHGAKITVVQFHGLKHHRGPFSSIPRYCTHYCGQVCHSNHVYEHGNGQDPKQSHDVFGHSTILLRSTTNVCTKDRNNVMSTIPGRRKWALLQTTCDTPKWT